MEAKLTRNILEACLMVAARPMSLSQLEALFESDIDRPDRNAIKVALAELQEEYSDRGIELKEVASGFRLQSREDVQHWVDRLFQERSPRYSRALLETLVLIAYRQPITRGEIEEIRGVAVSSNIIKTLQKREWVREVGHKDVPGKPALLGTTRQFLDYFNLKRLDELPSLGEIRDLEEIDPVLAAEIGLIEGADDSHAANDGSSDASGDVSTEEPADDVNDVSSGGSNDVPGDVPGDAPDDAPDDASSDISGDGPSDVSSDMPGDGPSEVSSDMPDDGTSEVSSDMSDDSPNDVSSGPLAEVTDEGVDDAVSEAPDQPFDEQISESADGGADQAANEVDSDAENDVDSEVDSDAENDVDSEVDSNDTNAAIDDAVDAAEPALMGAVDLELDDDMDSPTKAQLELRRVIDDFADEHQQQLDAREQGLQQRRGTRTSVADQNDDGVDPAANDATLDEPVELQLPAAVAGTDAAPGADAHSPPVPESDAEP